MSELEKLKNTLALIFYLIWIPLGLLLIAGIIFMIVANPFAGIAEMMSAGPPGGFGPQGFGDENGPSSGGFPSEEMMRQFMEQGEPPDGGDFGPPGQ